VLVGGADHHFRTYAAADGRLLEDVTLPAPVLDVAAAADGRMLVTGIGDNRALVFQRSLLGLVVAHQGPVTALAVTPDGKHAASAGSDNKVQLWELESGKLVRNFEGVTAAVHDLAISPDGVKLAAVLADKTLKVWKLDDGSTLHTATLLSPARGVAFVGADWIAAGGDDQRVRLLELSSGAVIEEFAGLPAGVVSLAASTTEEGTRLAAGSANPATMLWKVSAQRIVAGHKGIIADAVMSPDGESLFTAGADNALSQWKLNGELLRSFAGATAPLRAIAVSADDKIIVAVGEEKVLRAWSVADGQLLASIEMPTAATAVTIGASGAAARLVAQVPGLNNGGPAGLLGEAPNGFQVIVAGDDKILRNYGLASDGDKHGFTLVQECLGHTEGIHALVLAADGHALFSGGIDKAVRRWFAASASPTWSIDSHPAAVYSLDYHPNASLIATAGGDGSVRQWSAADGSRHNLYPAHADQAYAVRYHPSGQQLASTGRDRTLRVWDPAGRQLKQYDTPHGMYGLAYSPDGNWLVAAGLDKQWHAWTLADDKLQRSISGHPDVLYAVRYNPAGGRLITLDYAGQLFIWDPTNGGLIHHQQLPATATYSFAISPDGKQVACATSDHRVILVTNPPGL
jgi:WD40 repeat protein